MFEKIKQWIIDWAVAEQEIRASKDLEWRIFCQRHNLVGWAPENYSKGMESDPMNKAALYEFPNGDEDAPPNALRDIFERHRKNY